MADQSFKRYTAYKLRIGSILAGKPLLEGDRLKALDLGDRQISRANIIANIVDKFIQEGEKKFASLTLDDASGQIKVKAFGDDIERFEAFNQGDTVLVIGLVRVWNNEIYLTPDIIKKKEPSYLLLRKFEVEADMPKNLAKPQISAMKDKILDIVKDAEKDGGVEIDKIILELKEHPDIVNREIKRLLEDGIAYEPRPGKLRWLG